MFEVADRRALETEPGLPLDGFLVFLRRAETESVFVAIDLLSVHSDAKGSLRLTPSSTKANPDFNDYSLRNPLSNICLAVSYEVRQWYVGTKLLICQHLRTDHELPIAASKGAAKAQESLRHLFAGRRRQS